MDGALKAFNAERLPDVNALLTLNLVASARLQILTKVGPGQAVSYQPHAAECVWNSRGHKDAGSSWPWAACKQTTRLLNMHQQG